ncbi:membrane protein insertion efficiency factor YidD [Candidatus Methanomassiliicoccus intestinalis]|uniref:membrane protein insertion efficiency factor YidD n=1 Tax=Candidatus Methanomassiliicoccus intestinalis TaxID=1406512 RepID=UPI0037DD3B64
MREIPDLCGISPSPTHIQHLKKKHDYGTVVKIPFPNSVAILMITLYQHITIDKEHVCNHIPSCSEYARISFMRYGFFSALFLSIERLKECSDPQSNWPKENKP